MHKRKTSLLITFIGMALAATPILPLKGNNIYKDVCAHEEGVLISNGPKEDGPMFYPAEYSTDISDEPYYSTQNGYTFSSMNYVNTSKIYRGDSVKVAVIDSGLNYDHEDFKLNGNRIIKSKSRSVEYSSGWKYYEFSNNAAHLADGHGHGTNVASVIASQINALGCAGIAPNVELYVYKVTNANYGYEWVAIQNCLNYCIEEGIDVINMSFQAYENAVSYGGQSMAASAGCSSQLTSWLNACHNAGITLVGAAGNFNTAERSYPASNNYVISVGSLAEGSTTTKAGYSNLSDIDLVAPGTVYVADKGSTSAYKKTQGTSFSAPIVTAAIALYKQKNSSATPDQIESALYASCDAIDGNPSWAGNGRLNIDKFLGVDCEDQPTDIVINNPEVVDDELELQVGDYLDLDWTVNGVGTFDDSVNFYTLSGKDNVVSVNQNGRITAVSEGNDYVVIESNVDSSVYGSVYVSVTSSGAVPTVDSVTVSPSSLSLDLNGTKTGNLTATVNGTNNPSQAVTWTSSNTNVATVSSSGVVTAKATGNATITATSQADNTKSGTCTVTVTSHTGPTDTTQYSLITSVNDLEVGASYLIASGTSGTVKTMAVTSNTNNRPTTELTVTNSRLTRGSSALSVTLGGSEGAYTFKTDNYAGTAGYLNATNTTGSNYLQVLATLNDYAYFTISFSNSQAVITCTGKSSRNIIRINSSGTPIACYTSGQNPVYLWKETITKSVTSISISGNVTSYVEGDTFVKGTVIAHYSDSTTADVTNEATFTGYDMTSVSNQTVTVSYGGKSLTYNITVSAGMLSTISLSGQTTVYQKNSPFSFDGICTVTFANGYQKDVTPTSISSPDMSTGGVKEVTVSYTYNNKTLSTSYNITVNSYRTVMEASTVDGSITWPTSATPSITGDITGLSASTSGKTVYESSSMRLGTNNGGGTLNISASINITSLKITAKYYSSSYSSSVLKVDGQSITPLTSGYKDYTVTLSSAKSSFKILTENSNSRVNIQSITIYSQGPEVDIGQTTDCVGLETFISTYMHMDYTENLGYCKDNEHHYYSTAKNAFNNLNDHQRNLFTSNSAYLVEWTRLSTWASKNGDSLNQNNKLAVGIINPVLSIISDNSFDLIITLITISIASITICGYFILHKKRTIR